ncbi:hypothetical protein ACNQ1O_00585 [Mycoplasma sp. B6188]|uniref:hypothetical protein n=1 Tax=Mycoplasma sp. B6188 TaxID=3401673 RepID=UPI003AADE3AD
MKTILKLGEPINAIGNLSTSLVGTTVDNPNIINKASINKEADFDEFGKIFNQLLVPEFIKGNEELFSKLANFIQNSSDSSLKIVREKISDQDVKDMLIKFLNLAKEKKLIDMEQYNDALSKVDTFVAKFKTKFRKTIREEQSKIKEKQKLEKIINQEISKKYKQIITDAKKGYSVNVSVDKEKLNENSKLIGIEFIKLEDELKSLQSVSTKNLEIMKSYEYTIKKLNAAIIGMSVVSILSTIFSFFWPPATLGAMAAGATTFGLSLALDKFKNEYTVFEERNKIYESIENAIKNAKVTKSSIFDNLIAYGVTPIVANVDYMNNLYTLGKSGLNGLKKLKIKSAFVFSTPSEVLSGVLAGASIAIDGYTIYNSTSDIIRADKMINEINNFTQNLKNRMENIIKQMNNLKWVRWVVINETPIYGDDYSTGATGGKNLVFKNLITGEVKTLSEMLAMSNYALHAEGLTKAYNHDTKEWYIRTLPNNKKHDNLG